MKKIRNVFISFLVLFIALINLRIPMVNAATYTLRFGSPTGISYSASGPSLEGINTSDWNANYQYLLINDEIVFCLDPSQLVYSGASGYVEDDFSTELKKQMNLIALHGYYEHGKTNDWYMASQFMMWELRGWTIDSTNLTNYENMKNTIREAINHHYDKPNFINFPVSLNVGETITVTDSNNVLSRYTIADIPGVIIEKNGNNLTITPQINAADNVLITLGAYIIGEGTANIIYKTPGNSSQIVGKFSYYDPSFAYLNLKINKFGSLKIAKQDEDGVYIPDTSFTVSNNADMSSPIGTYITGVDGTVMINKLLPGTYYVQEIAVPGHLVLDGTIHSITVKPNETASYNAKNNWIKGKVKLKKLDTESGKQVGGGTYAIFDENNREVERLVTVPSDYVESGYLRIGKYTIKEVIAPDGYVLNPTVYPVNITSNEERIEINGSDIRVKGSLNLSKEDSITGKQPQGEASLAGATYELRARNAILDPADGAIMFEKDSVVHTLITDNEANASVLELYLGDYYVKETKPSHGYTLDQKEYDVSITYQNQHVEVVTKQQTVTERIISQAFQIIKISSSGSGEANKLQGAEFRIKAKKDIDKAGSWDAAPNAKNAKGEEAGLLISDKQGYAKSDELPYGTYIVRETKTPDNHYAVPDFIVIVDQDSREPQPWRIMNDEKFHAVVRIVKKDATSGNIIALAGAKFKIKNMNTNDYVGSWVWNPFPHYVDTWTSDKNGEVLTDDVLEPDDYQLEEIEAPEGYLLDKTPVPFTISANVAYETLPDGTTPCITIEKQDIAVVGKIRVEKKGEVVQGVEKDKNGNLRFLYKEHYLKGAVFAIYAKENITAPDHQGTILYHKDQKIATLISNDKGMSMSKDLPLGRYYVKEVQAPYGFIKSKEVYDVVLTYKNQTTDIVFSDIVVRNERQTFDIQVHKYDEEKRKPLFGAIFAISANHDVYNYEGDIIVEKGEKIETAESDAEGNIKFKADLPIDLTPKERVVAITEVDDENVTKVGNSEGLFVIKEVKAPNGYHIAKPVLLYLDTRQTDDEKLLVLYTFDVMNQKDETILPVPATGDNSYLVLWSACCIYAPVTGMIVYQKRKRFCKQRL